MSRGLGRRSGAAAAVLLALVVAAPAPPASAAEGGPAVTIDSPRPNATLTTDTVTVTGRVTAGDLSLHRLKDVTLTAGSDKTTRPCNESPCSFSWEISRPANGKYSVTAVATQTLVLLGAAGPPSDPVTHPFLVAAPPAKPTLDSPKVNEARNVELSWSRNTEPDMLYYALARTSPGASKPEVVAADIKQPKSGSKVSFTDTTTSPTAGGDFTYQVLAVRRGAEGGELVSAPSAARTATVPVLATTSTSTAPAPGTPAGGPTTTAKPGTSGGVDLSSFLSSRSAPLTPPVITVPEPPDTGFDGALPFGARPPSLDDIEEGEAEAVPPRDSTSIISRISPGRPLVPIAGGLVLLMLAMHMRVLNRRIQPVPEGGDLPVERTAAAPPPPAPPAPPPPAPKQQPAPRPEPAPQTALFDVDADEADHEHWAPVPAAPEPQPEPQPQPEPVVAAHEPEPEPDVVTLWAPEPEPEAPAVDPDAIEVVEVVSSNRRRLVRSGSR